MTKGELAFKMLEAWCKSNGYPTPVPEYQFAKSMGRKFRSDAAFMNEKVLLEFQGSVWKRGGHSTGTGITRDCEKFCIAATLGWRVMPVTYDQLNSGKVYDWLETIFTEGV